jgi:hypothetical protein
MNFNSNQNKSETSEKIKKISYVEVNSRADCGELRDFKYLAPQDEIRVLDNDQLTKKSIDLLRAKKLTEGLIEFFDFSSITDQWRGCIEVFIPKFLSIYFTEKAIESIEEKIIEIIERADKNELDAIDFLDKYGDILAKLGALEIQFESENEKEEWRKKWGDCVNWSEDYNGHYSKLTQTQTDLCAEIIRENTEIIECCIQQILFDSLLWSIQDLVGRSGWEVVEVETFEELFILLKEQYLSDPLWLIQANILSIQLIGNILASDCFEIFKEDSISLEQLIRFLRLEDLFEQNPEPFSAQRTALISTNPMMISSILALITPEDLQKDRDGRGFFISEFPNQLIIKTSISVHQTNSGNPNLLAFEQAQKVAENFNTSVASIHLVFAAHAQSLSRPWNGRFRVNCDELIDLLAIRSKRKGHSLPKLRADIYQMVQILQRIMVQAVRVNGDHAQMMTAPFWHITPEVELQSGLLNDFDHNDSVGFVISPSIWLDYCNGAGNSSFNLDLFKLRQDSLALKIALVVSITGTTTWTVKDLLEKAYGLSQLPSKIANSSQRRNQKKLFINALRKLKEILRWQYECNFSCNWLGSKVKIWKPQALNSVSNRLELPSKDMTSKVDGSIIIPRLHTFLVSRGERDYVTQSDLASLIGVRQADISEVSNGKRSMGKTFRKKLEAFIDTLALNHEEKTWILGQSKTPIRFCTNKLSLR